MGKLIYVTFSNGSEWAIPAHAVADSRSRYYAERDSEAEGRDYDAAYNEEYSWAMRDNYTLLDWASNNMDWEDVKGVSLCVEVGFRPLEDGQAEREWVNAHREVVAEA